MDHPAAVDHAERVAEPHPVPEYEEILFEEIDKKVRELEARYIPASQMPEYRAMQERTSNLMREASDDAIGEPSLNWN